MKFTGALSTLFVVLPFLVLQVSAAPSASLDARRARGRARGGRGGNANTNTKNKGAGAAGAGAAGAAGAGAGAALGGIPAAASQNSTINAGAALSAVNATDNNANNANNATGNGAGAAAGAGAGGDEQTSLTLDPSIIGPNLAQNGLNGNGTEAGQAASQTSTNNFINGCVGKTITNGLQIQGGSCNPVPMGDIPAKTNQPACKFSFPLNMGNVGENTAFTVTMAIQGMQTGAFVNPNTNYFAAPQILNGQGQIIGHSHIVIQSIPSLTATQPLDPTVFAFFQGLNAPAANGVLSAPVAKGLPAGTYRMFSINTAANHQPVIGPVAQHGSFDDAVYFTVGAAAAQAAAQAVGGAANNGTANAGAAGAAGAGAAGAAANNGTANAGAAGAGAAGAGAAGAAGAGAAGAAGAKAGAAAAGAGAAGAKAGAAAAGAGAAGAKAGAAAAGAAGAKAGAAAAGAAGAKAGAAAAGAGGKAGAAAPAQAAQPAIGGKGKQGRRSFDISRQN